MSDENLAMEVRKALHPEFSDNKVIGKIIAIGVSITTASAIAMLSFIWDLKSEVPLLKQGLANQQKNYELLQNSINRMSEEMQTARDNQTKTSDQLQNIESKIDERHFK